MRPTEVAIEDRNPTGAPLPLRALIRLAGPLGSVIGLDRDRLMAAAVATLGLDDWGDDSFREGLDRFLASANGEAGLNVVGRFAARRGIGSSLVNRLRFVAACRDTPEALAEPPRTPIVIAALPRTGSSLLQHLLGAHPEALSVPLWLGLQPLPGPDEAEWRAGGSPRRQRGARQTAWMVRTFEPAMMTKHPVAPDLPVECAYFMMSTFQALQWWAVWPVYGYAEWFESRGAGAAYDAFRAHLQLVQHRLAGRHWVLKSPGHFLRLEELLAAVPEAKVVRLHRDPVEVLASTHSLFATAHGLMSHRVDHRRSAAINTEALARAADRAVETPADPARVLDVRYDELVARPLEVVRAIHAWAGVPHDDAAETAIGRCLQARPAGKHGTHRYRPEEWLDVPATQERFAAYRRRFLDDR